MIFRHLICSFGLCLMLSFSIFSSTTDPREVNPNNFAQAINDGLKNSKCVSARLSTEEEMRLFESAGLIDIHMEIFLEREDIFINPLSGDEPELVKVKRLSYDVNAAGKKYYEVQPPFHKSFCYGDVQVIDILNFTEPADVDGLTVSRVTYTYEVKNIPGWVYILKEKYKWMEQDIESEHNPLKGTATLILTDKGWVHMNLLTK